MQAGHVAVVSMVDGEEETLDEHRDGSYFGEIALLVDNAPRETSVCALTFCNMFSFSKKSLNGLLLLYPEVASAMQKTVEARLKRWRVVRAGTILKRRNRDPWQGIKPVTKKASFAPSTDEMSSNGPDSQPSSPSRQPGGKGSKGNRRSTFARNADGSAHGARSIFVKAAQITVPLKDEEIAMAEELASASTSTALDFALDRCTQGKSSVALSDSDSL